MGIKIVEMDVEDIMFIAESMATMLVQVKKQPALLRLLPDNPQELLISMIELHARFKKDEPMLSEKDLNESMKAVREILAKAAGK